MAMAFDQSTRNRLQRLVSDIRALLTEEFRRQVQHQYGLDPATGEVAAIDKEITARRQMMQARIAVNPNIHFGKPCVAGTRSPVLSVLELVSEGLPFEAIAQDYYPELQIEDIQACVRYAMEVVAAEEIHIAVQG
jgi:uncharacterized protein (DUF433 family)